MGWKLQCALGVSAAAESKTSARAIHSATVLAKAGRVARLLRSGCAADIRRRVWTDPRPFANSTLCRRPPGAQLIFLQVVLVALRQARPRGADGMGRPGRPLRRSARRYSSQRHESHRMKMTRPATK